MGEEAKSFRMEFGDRQANRKGSQIASILPVLKPRCIAAPRGIRKSSRLTPHSADARTAEKSNDLRRRKPGMLENEILKSK